MVGRRVQERGAAAIVLAVFTAAVLIPLSALAVDLGAQRVGRKDVQAVADAVALDMARQLGEHNANAAKPGPPTNGNVLSTVTEATGAVGGTPVVRVWQGHVAGSYVSSQTLGCGMGINSTPSNGYFSTSPDPTTGKYNAVLVTATNQVTFSFVSGSGGFCRASIASPTSQTCFTVGSYAAALNGGTGVLGVLGLTGQVQAVGYQGLAHADVSITSLDQSVKALQLAAGVGTPQGLAASNVTLGQVLNAEALVLQNNGDVVNANVVNTYLGTLTSAQLNQNVSAEVAPLVSASGGAGSVLATSVNAFDLLAGSVMVANGNNLLAAYASSNLAGFTASASVIDGAHQGCGTAGATASSDQVTVDASENLGTSGVVTAIKGLSGLTGGTVAVNQAAVTTHVGLAGATGTLGSVSCNPDDIPVSVQTRLASLGVSTNLDVKVTGLGTTSGLLGALGLLSIVGVSATVDIEVIASPSVSTTQPASAQTLEWKMATGHANTVSGSNPDAYDTVKATGASTATVPNLSSVSSSALQVVVTPHVTLGLGALVTVQQVTNALISNLTSAVTNSTGAVLSAVNAAVVTPVNGLISSTINPFMTGLQNSLGLTLPGADVAVMPRAQCANPRLN